MQALHQVKEKQCPPANTPDLFGRGRQIMLDEDIRGGLVDNKMTLDPVINARILRQAQQELRKEGRLSQ